MSSYPPHVIVLIGPTASGKTELAIEIAEYFKTRIHNIDSRQIYKSMDIGTAKPSKIQQKKIKHFLIDIKDPINPINVKQFQEIAQKCRKKFYVSPFMDMETYYNFKLLNPSDKLSVFIKQTDSKGTVLTATQTGERKEFSPKQLMLNFYKYPLMTIKIISSIHFEALLLWKKGAIYRKRDTKLKNNLSYEEY